MIEAKLKSMHSPDIDRPKLPDDVSNCSVFISLDIGPHNEEGAEIFNVEVVTPNLLKKDLSDAEAYTFGKGKLVLNNFDWNLVEAAVNKVLLHCKGKTWEEVAIKVSRYFDWEFENYKDYEK